MISFIGKHLSLFFSESNGFLKEIHYNSVKSYLDSPIWRIVAVNNTQEKVYENDESFNFSSEVINNELLLYWNISDIKIIVNVSWQTEKVALKISVEADFALDRVVFPIIGSIKHISDNNESDYLILPWQNGFLIENPVQNLLSNDQSMPFWFGRNGNKYENEYPAQFSFQFMAYYGDKFGYYFATEDKDAYIKTIGLYLDEEKNGFYYAITNYPENMGITKSYNMSYNFVLQIFEGDWQTAVGIYRKWAIRQKWCNLKLYEKKIPINVLKTDLWRINHRSFALGKNIEEYYETSLILKEKLNCNLGLHWYGWNKGTHDLHYPDYMNHDIPNWEEELTEWNDKFSNEGIVKIPYVNARLWDSQDQSWIDENANDNSIKDKYGDSIDEPWNPMTILRPMCPATKMWREKVINFCSEYIKNHRFDGIYIDQVASFNATLCYNKEHPHPVGGGDWWNTSYHSMINGLKEKIDSDKILTTESCCETYIDLFDIFLVLDNNLQPCDLPWFNCGDALPLFNMIYGNYALSYGSICGMTDLLHHFEFNLVRNTLWGIIPTIEGFDLNQISSSDFESYYEVINKTVKFYKENKDLIIYGLPVAQINVDDNQFSITWGSDQNSSIKSYPEIFAMKWEDKEGNSYCVLYNFGETRDINVFGKVICAKTREYECLKKLSEK